MKTALVFGGVVAVVALVVTLALPMLGPVLDRYAESWVIGAVFNAVQFESPNRETISSVVHTWSLRPASQASRPLRPPTCQHGISFVVASMPVQVHTSP